MSPYVKTLQTFHCLSDQEVCTSYISRISTAPQCERVSHNVYNIHCKHKRLNPGWSHNSAVTVETHMICMESFLCSLNAKYLLAVGRLRHLLASFDFHCSSFELLICRVLHRLWNIQQLQCELKLLEIKTKSFFSSLLLPNNFQCVRLSFCSGWFHKPSCSLRENIRVNANLN